MDHSEIDAFIANDNRKIRSMYEAHRAVFMGFGKKYNLSPEALADIYQEAFIILREHAISGNLFEVKSTMRTYLFGIGKNLIFKELNKKNKQQSMLQVVKDDATYPIIEIEEEELTIEQKILREHFKKLGKKCQEMLRLYFYRGLTVKEIMQSAGYESENVVSSTKSRCLKQLTNSIKAAK